MRTSDETLFKALHEVGLYQLAAAAREGEYNEFFGERATPMVDLVADLKQAHTASSDPTRQAQIVTLLQRAMNGDFDATRAEYEEWRDSPEAQVILRELIDD